MKKFPLISSGILFLIFVSINAQADIVVFQQLPHQTGGGLTSSNDPEIQTSFQVYDDFTLVSSYSITGINWWGFYYPSDSGAHQFELTYYSYTGNESYSSPPDPNSGIEISYASVEATLYGGGVYQYSATLDTPLNLDAGTYWLSIYSTYQDKSWGWQNATPPYDLSGIYGGSIQTPYTGIPNNVAFQLIAENPVPIPSAAWLLGSGLIVLVVVGRRRRTV